MIQTVCLPSGIGDVSWAYSKLVNAGVFKYEVADGWPYRTVPFLELLDGVAEERVLEEGVWQVRKKAEYGQFNYTDIVAFEQASGIGHHPTWGNLSNGRGLERVLIEPNRHLEEGRPLADWLPDIPVEYHYKVNSRARDVFRAKELLEPLARPWTGVSAASYRGSEAWKTWSYELWSKYLQMYHAEVGGTIILLGGGWDDLTATLESDGYPCVVGKTSVSCVLEILRLLDYYVGFSSGLGVLRTVFRRNAFMLWPDHQVELSTSWAPPWMLEDGTYVASLWRDPSLVMRRTKTWLKACSKTSS